MRTLAFILSCVAGLWVATPSEAADHIDAPTATSDPLSDLLDLYVFSNPNDVSETVLAATVVPFAGDGAIFADSTEYRFHIDGGNGSSLEIRCSSTIGQTMTCADTNGTFSVSGPTGEIVESDGIRLFAGLRDDPFFFDQAALVETLTTGEPAFTDPGVDFLAGANVLSLVIGLDNQLLPGAGAEPVSVWASTQRIEGSGILGGLSGSWFDASAPGHGWILEAIRVEESAKLKLANQFVFYYFSYINGEPFWLVGNGPELTDNVAVVDALRFTGGEFGAALDPDALTNQSVGTMTFEFENCDNATVTFESTDSSLASYEIDIVRLTTLAGVDCGFIPQGQIDRVGRAAVATALIPDSLKDQYNFASDPSTWADQFLTALTAGLDAVDSLDGIAGNALIGDSQALGGALVDDRLIYQPGVACDQYLALELESILGFAFDPPQCGGRTLSADTVDVTLSALVNGTTGDIFDGVDANDKPFLDVFPFLADPHIESK